MESKQLKEISLGILQDIKAQDIQVLDVRKITDIADYLIIASGTSTRHVAATADRLLRDMQDHHIKVLGKEGLDSGEWALLDFGDVVIHLMLPKVREFYALEKLWGGSEPIQSAES